jgi:tryptophan-rich sensory protein
MRDEAWYRQLKKSPLNPPSWIFPIVWPILYIAIIASGVIYVQNGGSIKSTGFAYYMIAWILNLSWSPIYFTYKMTGISFIVILLMIVFIYLTIMEFYRTSKLASYLLLPYLIWVSFASYLNGYIYFMN